MARISKVAVRYAQALFDFSQEQDILKEVGQDMELLAKVIIDNRDLQLMLASPVILKPRKVKILNAIFEAHFNPITTSFIKIIVTAGREKHLLGIARYFKELYQTHRGIMTATLTSAVAMNESIKKEITSLVEEATGQIVELEEEVLPALIGGFILEFDNKQVDASLLSHFEKLRKEFKINRYIKGI